MSKNNQPLRFAIRINENPLPNECPLCTGKTNPNIGAELFLDGTDQIVCFDCGLLHSPLLAALVNMADGARFFVRYEDEFSEEWETRRLAAEKNNKGGLLRFPERRSA
jgi:hypothetical protein